MSCCILARIMETQGTICKGNHAPRLGVAVLERQHRLSDIGPSCLLL